MALQVLPPEAVRWPSSVPAVLWMEDVVTFYADTWPVARKEHRCGLCARVIRPGEKYRRGVALEGTAHTFKECRHCRAVMDLADPTDGDWEYYDDVLSEWEPYGVAEMRWKAQWKRKWERRDGDLYPVPSKEAS